MDGAGGNDNNASQGGGSNPRQLQQHQPNPADRSRAVRAELELKRRESVERRRYFQPLVREQIVRVFGDIKPAWYARLVLMTPANYATLAEFSLLGLAVDRNELLPDNAAHVITEHVAKGADRSTLITFGLAGVAGYYAWRGRRSFRFPFYTPKSVSGNRQMQSVWHAARYTAYFVCVSLAIKGPLMGLNFMYTNSQINKDPRLKAYQSGHSHEETQQAGMMDGAGMDGYNDGGSYQNQMAGDALASQQQQQQQQQQSIAEAAQPGWDSYKQTSSSASQQQQSRGGWDDISDFDDASPVAFSQPQNDRAYNDTSGGGSSWDRLRRQSQGAPQQRQQQPPQQPLREQSGRGSWGDSGDGVDRAAQERAQHEFDQLVERDRHGEGQDRSWGKR